MPLHPEAQALLDQFEALGDPPIETSTPEAVRALRASRIQPPTVALAGDPRRRRRTGSPRASTGRARTRGLGLLVYFHGGGWVLGNLDTHDHVARALAAESGCAVLSVDYRLAPEHPFPAGLDDAFTASAWAYENAAVARMRPRAARDRRRLRGREPRGRRHAGGRVPVPLPASRLPGHRRAGRHGRRTRSTPTGRGSRRRACAGSSSTTSRAETGALDDPRVSPLLADDAAFAALTADAGDHRRARPAARRGRGLRRAAPRARRRGRR